MRQFTARALITPPSHSEMRLEKDSTTISGHIVFIAFISISVISPVGDLLVLLLQSCFSCINANEIITFACGLTMNHSLNRLRVRGTSQSGNIKWNLISNIETLARRLFHWCRFEKQLTSGGFGSSVGRKGVKPPMGEGSLANEGTCRN